MPLAVSLLATPRLRVYAAVRPVWRRLHRLALRAVDPLLTFWHTLFSDVRREMAAAPLAAALRGPLLLDAEQQAMAIWERFAVEEAWALLPLLLRESMAAVGRLVAEDMQAVAGERVSLLLGLQEPVEAIQRETGTLLGAVTTTTVLGLRALLHSGRAEGLTPASHAGRIQEGFGLTSRQVHSLEQARATWQAEGQSAAQIQQGIQEVTARGLAQRTRVIAETQAFRAVNLGHRLAMTQAAQAGPLGVGSVRRYWVIVPGACSICRAIPGMNSAGVPLDQPFQSPNGALMDPPAHVLCRCHAEYRRGV